MRFEQRAYITIQANSREEADKILDEWVTKFDHESLLVSLEDGPLEEVSENDDDEDDED